MANYNKRRVHTLTVFDIETGDIIRDEYFEYDGPWALADRSVQNQASQAFQQAGTTAGGYGTAAGDVNSTLVPTLKSDIANPQGFTPAQKSSMLTAGEQSLGGSTAGVVGQAGLQGARTRNTGSTSAILDQAMRRRAQGESQNALGVENESARLAQQKRASALSGLERTYGTDVGAQLKAMGIEPEDLNAELNAGKTGWLQNAEGIIDTFKPKLPLPGGMSLGG